MVTSRTESVVIPTYEPALPDPNPMFLEKRVYQGSSGRVYPLPFIDRIAETKTDRAYQVITLENEYLEVQLLPEIGGRIHAIKDKTNGYDIIYKQESIKPALVGLAGPWISGGIEFNWPQHHRPATFMPVECAIEQGEDGSVTAWMADHDPMARMRGLHGICLKPGSNIVELKVRAYNRTNDTQTFLWWANVANAVHEQYQSFFPPDVYYVADHAKRSMSAFPACQDQYYGVPYADRAKKGVPPQEAPRKFVPPGTYPENDLSWYANIPVPTSYMCMGTQEDFFGGYDHKEKAGFIHFANHHVSPGKKQWTWGNHEFGYAWDRLLSDDERPYVELMAGVYTDNQPDFSYLQPGETKTWSQSWYPIRAIGVAHQATLDAAVSLTAEKKEVRVGVSVTAAHKHATITLACKGKPIHTWIEALSPAQPFTVSVPLPTKAQATDLRLEVRAKDGRVLIAYQPKKLVAGEVPPPATEPPHPSEIKGNDELYTTGLHLEQYRHATRSPVAYWQEALKRDPQDSRCNTAMGRWHLRRGELDQAEKYLRLAIDRLVRRNPNPENGEAYYQLGQCLLAQGRDGEAYAAFYKGCWNQAWASAGYHAIAELDSKKGDWKTAEDHLRRSLALNTGNLRARNLLAMVLAKAGSAGLQTGPGYAGVHTGEVAEILRGTLALDPLDSWALWLQGKTLACDAHAMIDLAHDLVRAGFHVEADGVLTAAAGVDTRSPRAGLKTGVPGALGFAPLVAYTRGWIATVAGDAASAKDHFKAAQKTDPTYCFPARLEDIRVLEAAIKADPKDALAPYLLGNLFYDRRRHGEAIACFEKAVKLNPKNAIAWRNLGIGYFNIQKQPAKAKAAYAKAVAAKPADARLLYEQDQLWKRLCESPAKRLKALEAKKKLVASRDDLTVEYGALLNQVGRHAEAQVLVAARVFQPWEGGEGQALGLHTRTHLALGRALLSKGDAAGAVERFAFALSAPRNLNEARHLLANASDIQYWLGTAADAAGDKAKAKHHWTLAADFRGDFQNMSVCAYSEMTYYSALSLVKLGRKAEAQKLLKGLLRYAKELKKATAKIDYFATSLPTMLLFDADIQAVQETAALFLEAQAQLALGQKAAAKKLLAAVLKRDPNHALAADLLAGA